MYDAVQLFARAVNAVPHVIRMTPLSCDQDRAWKHGADIVSSIKTVTMHGCSVGRVPIGYLVECLLLRIVQHSRIRVRIRFSAWLFSGYASGTDPRICKRRGPIPPAPSPPCPVSFHSSFSRYPPVPFPLELGPLKPAGRSGERCKLPGGIRGGAAPKTNLVLSESHW